MRVICLDVGERRIGVAVSDPLDLTAQGVETIFMRGIQHDAARIAELCRQYETAHILCGLPLNMDGSEGFQAQRVRQVAEVLREMGFEVRFQDERLTTKLATGVLLEADVRRSRRKDVVDKLAATYILQSFLDAGGWQASERSGKQKISFFQSEVWRMNENEMNMGMEPEQETNLIIVFLDIFLMELVLDEHIILGEFKSSNLHDTESNELDADDIVLLHSERTANSNILATGSHREIEVGNDAILRHCVAVDLLKY